MYYGRMCRAQGEVTLMFSCRIWFSWAGFLGPGHVRHAWIAARAAAAHAAPRALQPGGVSGSGEWAHGLLQPPGARTEMLQHARLTVETADLGVVLAMLPCFWAYSLCFWFSSELGTCYPDTGTQSVGAPAGLPCALLPGIKESQSFAVPDSSVGMKYEVWLKCENTVSATESNCTWCLGRHISCKLCQCPYLLCPLSYLNTALGFRVVG